MDSPSETRRRLLRVVGTLGAVGLSGLAGCSGSGGDSGSDDGDSAGAGDEADTGDDSGSSGGDGSSGGSSGGADGDASEAAVEDPTYDGWLDGAQGYSGSPADRTGQDSVEVSVGTGNGLAFEPAAVRVSPGTTVVWTWTGQGGSHNVSHVDGDYESELAAEEGFTFEHAFESAGVSTYRCVPHEAVGMKGVVDVVES